jgi:hypothetical protein
LYIPSIAGSAAGLAFEGTTFTLPRNISAIQAVSEPEGSVRLGTLLQLPEGTQVRVCGDGFNERTVKVAWEGAYYFIFWEDLELEGTLRTRTSAAGKF